MIVLINYNSFVRRSSQAVWHPGEQSEGMRTPHALFGTVILILVFHLSVYPHLPPPFIPSARIVLGP
jgi:hypothetical protein